MSEWIKQKDAVLWRSEAKNSREKIEQLTESNRQLREENEQVKAQLNPIKKRPAKCNDGLPGIVDFVEMEKIEQERNQLREELGRVEWQRNEHIADKHRILRDYELRAVAYRTALAAAKEALEKATMVSCSYPLEITVDELKDSLVEFAETTLKPALARIAECEKGTT